MHNIGTLPLLIRASFNTTTGWHKCQSPSDKNLSSSDWDFWPTGWEAFPLCSIQ